MRGASSDAGTAYPTGAPVFIPGFEWGWCAQSLRFLCNILFFFAWPFYCMFFFDLRLPFGIFKYFLNLMYNIKQTKTKTSRYQRVNQNP